VLLHEKIRLVYIIFWQKTFGLRYSQKLTRKPTKRPKKRKPSIFVLFSLGVKFYPQLVRSHAKKTIEMMKKKEEVICAS
jgi:hypothetical protein